MNISGNYNTKSSNTNFTAFRQSPGLMDNPKRKKIAEFIMKKLSEPDPSSGKKISYVDRAEKNGHNVWLSSSKDGKGVRVDTVHWHTEETVAKYGLPIDNYSFVGVYKKPEEFTTQQFDAVSKPYEETVRSGTNAIMTMFYGSLVALVGLLSFIGYADFGSKKTNNNKIENVVKDTTKTDSIKPLLKDTLDLSKRIKK